MTLGLHMGQEIRGWELLAPIAAGASGSEVWRVQRVEGGVRLQERAAKIFRAAASDLGAAVAEAESLQAVSHRHVVAIVDIVVIDLAELFPSVSRAEACFLGGIGIFDDRDHIVMIVQQLAQGSLADRLECKTVGELEAALVMRDVANGVAAIHDQTGLGHGDLRTANILEIAEGDHDCFWAVADLGLATDHPSAMGEDGSALQTMLRDLCESNRHGARFRSFYRRQMSPSQLVDQLQSAIRRSDLRSAGSSNDDPAVFQRAAALRHGKERKNYRNAVATLGVGWIALAPIAVANRWRPGDLTSGWKLESAVIYLLIAAALMLVMAISDPDRAPALQRHQGRASTVFRRSVRVLTFGAAIFLGLFGLGVVAADGLDQSALAPRSQIYELEFSNFHGDVGTRHDVESYSSLWEGDREIYGVMGGSPAVTDSAAGYALDAAVYGSIHSSYDFAVSTFSIDPLNQSWWYMTLDATLKPGGRVTEHPMRDVGLVLEVDSIDSISDGDYDVDRQWPIDTGWLNGDGLTCCSGVGKFIVILPPTADPTRFWGDGVTKFDIPGFTGNLRVLGLVLSGRFIPIEVFPTDRPTTLGDRVALEGRAPPEIELREMVSYDTTRQPTEGAGYLAYVRGLRIPVFVHQDGTVGTHFADGVFKRSAIPWDRDPTSGRAPRTLATASMRTSYGGFVAALADDGQLRFISGVTGAIQASVDLSDYHNPQTSSEHDFLSWFRDLSFTQHDDLVVLTETMILAINAQTGKVSVEPTQGRELAGPARWVVPDPRKLDGVLIVTSDNKMYRTSIIGDFISPSDWDATSLPIPPGESIIDVKARNERLLVTTADPSSGYKTYVLTWDSEGQQWFAFTEATLGPDPHWHTDLQIVSLHDDTLSVFAFTRAEQPATRRLPEHDQLLVGSGGELLALTQGRIVVLDLNNSTRDSRDLQCPGDEFVTICGD